MQSGRSRETPNALPQPFSGLLPAVVSCPGSGEIPVSISSGGSPTDSVVFPSVRVRTQYPSASGVIPFTPPGAYRRTTVPASPVRMLPVPSKFTFRETARSACISILPR